MVERTKAGRGVGIGVDAFGTPVDPSENVKALSEAASKRQDDLRLAENALFESKSKCLEEIICLHVKHMKEMSAAESRRVDEQAALRSEYADKLSNAEAKRIDAIRAVDVNAVAVDRAKASDQATVLATQVAQTAEALRSLVATTAATTNQANQAANNVLSTRVTTLEQAQYKGEGQSGVRDPQLLDLLAEVKALREAGRATAGVAHGVDKTWAIIAAIVGLVLTLVGVAIAFAVFSRGPTVAPPQIVYAPAPAAPPTVTPPVR